MACEHCGAPTQVPGSFCRLCGGHLDVSDTTTSATAPARFEAVASHPAYAEAMQQEPPADKWTLRGALTVGGLMFALLGAALVLGIYAVTAEDSARSTQAIVWGGVCVAFAGLIVLAFFLHSPKGPIRRELLVVLERRRGRLHGTATFLTFQDRDGNRCEYEAADFAKLDLVVAGDIGVAFIQGDFLTGFARIEG